MGLKWRHAGQACITANRVYVQSGVYDKFASILQERTRKLVVGHGADKSTTMGPVTTPQGVTKALNQVEDAKKLGGQIVLGGSKITGMTGYFFEPTIILGAKREMLVTEEESFAPILALYSFDTEDEAVQAANDTSVSFVLDERLGRWLNEAADGPGFVLLHEEHRPHVETAREPRGWHDWNELWYVDEPLLRE